MRFGPDRLEEGGEAFVEPDIAPILAGDQVAEPLMGEFVGDELVFVKGELGYELGAFQGLGSVGSGAGVFHAAGYEIVDHHLCVFFPGVIDAYFFVEEIDHLGCALVVG